MQTINQVPALFNSPISQRAMQRFAAMREQKSELAAGITGGFGVISFKGKTFAVRYQGTTTALMADAAQPGMPPQPKQWLEAVIIKASDHLSRTYYIEGYKDDSHEAPDCYSIDGIKPEPDSPKRQADLCAICPWSKFGTARDQSGARKGKACQESKRLAVVPEQDIHNEAYGGPMLLRVPPSSLMALQGYANDLARAGIPFWGVSTYIYFAPGEAYPRLMFKGHRPLSDEEFEVIERFRDDDQVKRIIDSKEGVIEGAAEPAPALFGGPPDVGQAAPVAHLTPEPSAPPVAQVAPAPVAPAPAPAPVPVQATPQPVETDAERMIRELQAQLAAAQAAQPAPQPTPAPVPEPSAPPVAQAAPPAAAEPSPAPTPTPAAKVAPAAPAPAPSTPAAPAPSDDDFTNFLAGMSDTLSPA